MRKVRSTKTMTGPALMVGKRFGRRMIVSKNPKSKKVWMILENIENESIGLNSTETRELYELLKAAARKGFFRS